MSAACTASIGIGPTEVSAAKPTGVVAGSGGYLRAPGVKLPRRRVAKEPVGRKPSVYDPTRECEGEVDERFQAVALELQPKTILGNYFTRRIAVGMVRVEQCERHEAAMLAFRQRHAGEAFDRARLEAAQGLLRRLDGTDPRAARAAHREMRMMPEGVDLLIERLVVIRAQAAREEPSWCLDFQEAMRLACGWLDEEVSPTRGWTLARALMGDGRLLSPEDRAAAQAAPNFNHWAGFALAEELAKEIDGLRAHRATLDHETIELDRLEAPERAVFDPGIAATRARAYEAKAAKEVRQSLDAVIAVEAAAEVATLAPDAPDAGIGEPAVDASDAEHISDPEFNVGYSFPIIDLSAVLGSFCSGTVRTPRGDKRKVSGTDLAS